MPYTNELPNEPQAPSGHPIGVSADDGLEPLGAIAAASGFATPTVVGTEPIAPGRLTPRRQSQEGRSEETSQLYEYRTHVCGALSAAEVGKTVRVSGWLATIRDHGGLVFTDIRDQSGRVQVVFNDLQLGNSIRELGRESVVSIEGELVERLPENRNPGLPTGDVEIVAKSFTVLSAVTQPLPFELADTSSVREELRLTYRFLDLRSERLQRNVRIRYEVIRELRKQLDELDFIEVQTPILTSSSPEGARDFLVPSRRYPGSFYALPQAPQQFKQLLMTGGIERYFQIAPCFRDEDGRADRSPGEFYQLDIEMAFATQEDVFAVVEQILDKLFEKFSDIERTPIPYPRIPYAEAMLKYGSDKPDLRNPLLIVDLTSQLSSSDIRVFQDKTVRAIRVPNGGSESRRFFDSLNEFAQSWGAKGMAWLKLENDGNYSGSIAKAVTSTIFTEIVEATQANAGDAILFIADAELTATKIAGALRTEVASRLDLLEKDAYRFCWIVDFPLYERNEDTGEIEFSHNPFSMPQGGAAALETEDLTSVLAHQYDIVCNGYELSSGAVRNHDPELMVKAFELAGYSEEDVKQKFGALYNAFQFGAPPHAGIAPGIDRILMLLTGESIIREVVAFPMTVNARDLLMKAPGQVTDEQLRELNVTVTIPKSDKRL